MEKYSISQVSKKLNIPRDTLRYYDKLGLVSPIRGDNRYRYYTDVEIGHLMYIRVMKFGGLSLEEIQLIFKNMNTTDRDCRNDTIDLLNAKKAAIHDQICRLQESIDLITLSVDKLKKKKCQQDIKELVTTIYSRLEPPELS